MIDQGGVIDIEPAQPQYVYVPVYDPTVIYGSWSDAYVPPYWYPPAIYGYPDFAPGFAVGHFLRQAVQESTTTTGDGRARTGADTTSMSTSPTTISPIGRSMPTAGAMDAGRLHPEQRPSVALATTARNGHGPATPRSSRASLIARVTRCQCNSRSRALPCSRDRSSRRSRVLRRKRRVTRPQQWQQSYARPPQLQQSYVRPAQPQQPIARTMPQPERPIARPVQQPQQGAWRAPQQSMYAVAHPTPRVEQTFARPLPQQPSRQSMTREPFPAAAIVRAFRAATFAIVRALDAPAAIVRAFHATAVAAIREPCGAA